MDIFLIITGIILIVAGIAVGVTFLYRNNNYGEEHKLKLPTILAIVGIVIAIFGASFTIIPTGMTGVRSTLGQIDETPCPNGWNWRAPFVQSIEKVNNKMQDKLVKERVYSETSERTTIFYEEINVTYQINPEKSAWIYANVTDYKSSLVTYDVIESGLKSTSKLFEDIDATNRDLIEPMAKEKIQKAFDEKFGENVIIINRVTIANADFTDEYNAAIEAKQQAKIKAEEQAITNQKNIDQATAEAEAARIKAQGEADAKELLQKAITDETLQEKWLDKWDGKLPQYIGGDDSSVLFGLNGIDVSSETK